MVDSRVFEIRRHPGRACYRAFCSKVTFQSKVRRMKGQDNLNRTCVEVFQTLRVEQCGVREKIQN